MPSEHDPRFPYRNELEMPVIGLEAEFKVFIDDEAVTPEDVWRTPAAFIDRPLLRRTSKSSQLPTRGAVYFDGGVLGRSRSSPTSSCNCGRREIRD